MWPIQKPDSDADSFDAGEEFESKLNGSKGGGHNDMVHSPLAGPPLGDPGILTRASFRSLDDLIRQGLIDYVDKGGWWRIFRLAECRDARNPHKTGEISEFTFQPHRA